MEAIAGASRVAVAGCLGFRAESVLPASEAQSVVFAGVGNCLGRRRGGLRTVGHSCLSSAASFEDQGHLQFYLDVHHGSRKGTRTSTATAAAAVYAVAENGAQDYQDHPRRNKKDAATKAEKMEKKALKKLRKASRATAEMSSSSSSSESEADKIGHRVARSGKRRDSIEALRREWETVSRSPLMSSIPTISRDFVIEQPEDVISKVLNGVMELRVGRDEPLSSESHGSSNLPAVALREPSPAAPKVEVCMGGKCKRAGAQEVLSAFQANGVAASACNKCMRNCKLAINVRVQDGNDEQPKMYSGIGVDDVTVLSRKYSGPGQMLSHSAC